MVFEKPVVIIDNGSNMLKAGFACDNHPVSMFRTVVGRPNYLKGSYGRKPYEVYIGDDAIDRIEDYELSNPVVNGRIAHWDNMERVWHHVLYRELKVAPEDRGVILSSNVNTTMQEKIHCCEVFFETLNTPALCIQPQPVMSLYASGFTTGMCVDLGHDTVDISPVYEGGVIKYAHMMTNYAGIQVINYINDSLRDRGHDFGIHTLEILGNIQKQIYITSDCAMSRRNYKREHILPDGQAVDISQEVFMAGEMFYQPTLVMGEDKGILSLHDAVITAAMKCDADLRTELFDAIVPCGGMSMIPGLPGRLGIEIEESIHRPVNILTSGEAYALAWLGGAVFAGLPDSGKIWIFKKQFEDHGAKIVRNKFM
ncbi:actin-3-like [Plodia interpunctella]|uniref:actin-3-like n=1 Tax=Plodia interpunctella TaxID=58824 RepID=UPI002367703B|nr:actin-3-like [Plodia interpunctella]